MRSALFLLPFLLPAALACRTAGPTRDSVVESLVPVQIPGPRRTVAVARFDAVDDFAGAHGGQQVGSGLSAMLTTALVESDRFVVLERPELDHVLTEQGLGQQRLTQAGTAPAAGRLSGAQFLIFGNVTEFGLEDEGGGVRLGASGLLDGLAGGLGLSRRGSKGSVGMDLRVVDTTTGAVVASFQVHEELSRSSSGLDASVGRLGFGSDSFQRTPLGQAARRAIERVVERFAREVAGRPWRGSIVSVDGLTAVVNAGAADGVQVGDTFTVHRVLEELTDPETGARLGERKQELGTLAVTEVDERVAFATWTPAVVGVLERGDVVTSL